MGTGAKLLVAAAVIVMGISAFSSMRAMSRVQRQAEELASLRANLGRLNSELGGLSDELRKMEAEQTNFNASLALAAMETKTGAPSEELLSDAKLDELADMVKELLEEDFASVGVDNEQLRAALAEIQAEERAQGRDGRRGGRRGGGTQTDATPEDRLARYVEKLNLSYSQEQGLAEAFNATTEARAALFVLRQAGELERFEMRTATQEIRTTETTAVEQLLSPTQYTKFLELQAEEAPVRGGGGAPTPTPPAG